jgi:hypothetical protein
MEQDVDVLHGLGEARHVGQVPGHGLQPAREWSAVLMDNDPDFPASLEKIVHEMGPDKA